MPRTLVLAAALAFAPGAAAAAPAVSAQASASGLAVTFSASGDTASYHWDFGDGQSGDGTFVQHTYARPGAYTATVTAIAPDGETARTEVQVTASALTLTQPHVAVGYGHRMTFRGALVPAAAATVTLYHGPTPIASAPTRPDGSYRITARIFEPGGYAVRTGTVGSNGVTITVRPLIEATFFGSTVIGRPLELRARLHPGHGGRLVVTVFRNGTRIATRAFGWRARLPLDTRRAASLRIRIATEPAAGYAARSAELTALVVERRLAAGSAGASVVRLSARLAELHYVAPRTATFDGRLVDGLYAFQKVQGLPRTGVADPATWAALADSRIPRPHYTQPADHLEIDKPHQVLYVVRGGQTALIVPVSTAGVPGDFTPEGRFAIYRKVVGFDPSPLGILYDPMYFTGGYAIHGNPSVPPYPASHGCVRVPMWVIASLYASNPYGETVYVY